ncbi:MAG: hypothetical protein R2834_11545 [Rhodothermales bacterium]
MNDKIKEFLDQVGYEAAEEGAAGMHLLRYFEQEYGVSLMSLIEQEWLDEQVQYDMDDLDFQSFRDAVSDDDLPAFDRDLEALFGR